MSGPAGPDATDRFGGMAGELARGSADAPSETPSDAIAEIDRPVPAGFLWMVAVGVAFAAGLWLWLRVADAPGSLDRYLADRAAALDTGALLSEEMLFELAGDPLAVSAGERAYAEHCATCHGSRAEGDTGPSLVDSEWMAKSEALDIYTTIVEGRNAEGMPPWGSLGPGTCMQITAYLLTLRDTEPPAPGSEQQEPHESQ